MGNNITISNPNVSQADILWAFYQSQKQSVKKAFIKRLEAEKMRDEHELMEAYESKLAEEERKNVRKMVKSVKRSIKDIEQNGIESNKKVRKASGFLEELQNDVN